MSHKQHRHCNKYNKKPNHVARSEVKISKSWFECYKECIIDTKSEVWILDFKKIKPVDLVVF